MFEKYFNKFFINAFAWGFGSLFLGIPFIAYSAFQSEPIFFGIPIITVFLFIVSYVTYKNLSEEEGKNYSEKLTKLQAEVRENVETNNRKTAVAEHEEQLWRQLLKERTSGFPSLFQNIAYYEKLIDDDLSDYLKNKPHPALSASEVVKEEARRRREAEFHQRKTQAIIEYYETIAPFLLDYKEQEIGDDEEALRDYTDEEREDPVTNYLTKEEYRKLSSTERNQMALERFWKRSKPKWLIGRLYERYVGYLYESQGYDVSYEGVFKGYEDLGRDLICRKGKEIVVIQCKNWSQFRTIFEKHIFQFFGTVFQYRDENKGKLVRGVFYTTTRVSDLARRFAKELNVEIIDNHKFNQNYPCIKCNISDGNGTRIYHLPFDQQYDTTRIEPKRGELYCATVVEAEEHGFRRAFRWKGNNQN